MEAHMGERYNVKDCIRRGVWRNSPYNLVEGSRISLATRIQSSYSTTLRKHRTALGFKYRLLSKIRQCSKINHSRYTLHGNFSQFCWRLRYVKFQDVPNTHDSGMELSISGIVVVNVNYQRLRPTSAKITTCDHWQNCLLTIGATSWHI